MSGVAAAEPARVAPWAGTVLASSRRVPDLVAIRGHGEIRIHGRLADRAARFAHWLGRAGIGPGDRVGLLVEDRADAIEAYLGVGLSGATAVHLNDRLAAPEVAEILDRVDLRLLVHTSGRTELAEAAIAGHGSATVVLGEDAVAGGNTQRYADLVAQGHTTAPVIAVDPGSAAIVGFTSGTTGFPKGVVHTQENLARIIRYMPIHDGLRPYSRCAFTGTLAFVAGLWGVVWPHLYLGGEVSFMAGLPPADWVDRMIAEQSTFTYAPTPLVAGFTTAVRARPEVLTHLEVVLHSASVLHRDTAAELVATIGGRYVETYGMTETGAPVTATVPADWRPGCPAEDILASAGRPGPLARVRVVDGLGAPLPAGQTGELEVTGETLFAGYLDQPELTARAMHDGWLRTGDAGRLDDAGFVYVTDRLTDMIVSGGMNVYPAEVERVLARLPGVAEVAVLGLPDPRWGETVVAAVVPRAGARLDPAEVIAASRDQLAGYKKPTRVVVVDDLPRTASLKVNKDRLRDHIGRLPPDS